MKCKASLWARQYLVPSCWQHLASDPVLSLSGLGTPGPALTRQSPMCSETLPPPKATSVLCPLLTCGLQVFQIENLWIVWCVPLPSLSLKGATGCLWLWGRWHLWGLGVKSLLQPCSGSPCFSVTVCLSWCRWRDPAWHRARAHWWKQRPGIWLGNFWGRRKTHPWLRGHQGREIWSNVRALVFRGSQDCEAYGSPDCASSLVPTLHIQVLQRGTYANQKLKLQLWWKLGHRLGPKKLFWGWLLTKQITKRQKSFFSTW